MFRRRGAPISELALAAYNAYLRHTIDNGPAIDG